MDYFFAQIEEIRNPEYKNKIIAVCIFSGRTEDSGVISTVNYEGRNVGIKSGMPIVNAKKLAKSGIFLPADHKYYESISQTIDGLIRSNCTKVEKSSIDEWYALAEDEVETGKRIKLEILNSTNLTCTVGVAHSRLGAKMASDKAKPNGFLILGKEKERNLIDNSPVEKIIGIGPKTKDELNELGVKTVSDLRGLNQFILIEKFGKKTGAWLYNLGIGIYDSEIEERIEKGEFSRIGSLKENTREKGKILEKIVELEREAKEELKYSKKFYKTLTLIFITEDIKMHTKSRSFSKPRGEKETNLDEIKKLMSEFLDNERKEVRRVGVKFSGLVEMDGQTTLF